MRKRCILLEECEFGAEVLWYEPWDSGKPEDEQHYMRIFRHETGDHYIAMVQPHMVVPIPDEVKSEWKWGRWFPEQSWLDTVIPQWLGTISVKARHSKKAGSPPRGCRLFCYLRIPFGFGPAA